MSSHSAITKLQAIFIIDLIIVAFAFGGYYYVTTLPKTVEFQLADLVISPQEASVGEPVKISAKVINTGDGTSNQTVDLIIDDTVEQTKAVNLLTGTYTVVEFMVTKFTEGSYSVRIGALNGIIRITANPPPLKPAEFQLSNLVIMRPEAGIGEPVRVSAVVTNTGEQNGTYLAMLMLEDRYYGERRVDLSGGESTVVEFMVTKFTVGNYSVRIGALNGIIRITANPPPLKPAEFQLSNLVISPDEAGIGQPVKISVKVINVGEETGNYTVDLEINGGLEQTKVVKLSGGASVTVEFAVTEEEEGSYSVEIGNLTGTLIISAAIITHSLSVKSILSPAGADLSGIVFTLDGESRSTPHSATSKEGTHTVEMPEEHETGYYIYRFDQWEDGSKSRERTINLVSDMSIVASYIMVQSCPWLYVWNGEAYIFVAEVSGSGYLGYLDRLRDPPAFNKPYPWDYVKLDNNQLLPRNGFFDMLLTQVTDEIIYLDSTWLMVVDHPKNVDVYSTEGTEFTDPEIAGKIYTVSKNPSLPVSCVNEDQEDCLPQISKIDGVCAGAREFGRWQYLELNLGNLSEAKEIKLIISGYTTWIGWEKKWIELLKRPDFSELKASVYPYLEVKDENGNWTRVPQSRNFPETSDTPRTFIVELTGLFPTSDYSIRINMFTLMNFDLIGVDVTPQQNITLQRLDPVFANLHQRLLTNSTSTGNFTRYGDVTPLLHEVDDKFAIIRQGDEISLKIPANITPVATDMERDFFLYTCAWYKKPGNPAYAFTVDLLPFYNMSTYPYPPSESYPYDEDHLKYLKEYNTRKE